MINKSIIQSIISKYYLNGIIETVKWEIKNKKLKIKFISPVKDMVGEVEYSNFDLPNNEVTIYNTSQLNKLLSTTLGDILLEISNNKLHISDSQFAINYALADALLAPKVPDINEPETYEVELDLTRDHIDAIIKAKGAVSDTDHVNIKNGATVDMDPTIDFIIGDNVEHSNKITYSIPIQKQVVIDLPFNVNYIKEVLSANKECSGKMYISEVGLIKIEFNNDLTKSTYFIVGKSEM